MMKVSILGCGDISKIWRHTDLSKEKVIELINSLSEVLAKKRVELVMLPARGVPYAVAEAYKKSDGEKVIGLVPSGDKKYGLGHIEKYLGIEDERVNLNSWYELNGEIGAKGDVCLVIGMSPGVMCEICMLKYHYKYLNSKTKLVIFRKTISEKLPEEVEEDLKEVHYVNSLEELEDLL